MRIRNLAGGGIALAVVFLLITGCGQQSQTTTESADGNAPSSETEVQPASAQSPLDEADAQVEQAAATAPVDRIMPAEDEPGRLPEGDPRPLPDLPL